MKEEVHCPTTVRPYLGILPNVILAGLLGRHFPAFSLAVTHQLEKVFLCVRLQRQAKACVGDSLEQSAVT